MNLLILSILLWLFQSPISTEDALVIYSSSSSTKYTSGSAFESNLKTLLTSLSTNGVLNYESYYSTIEGNVPNKVFGFSQCMSNSSQDICRQCLADGAVDIIQSNNNETEVSVRYYDCILRYSYQIFVTRPVQGLLIEDQLSSNVSEASDFNEKLGGLLKNLSYRAMSLSSKYATEELKFETDYDFEHLYASVQCTRDLILDDCFTCLLELIDDMPKCCKGRRGGQFYGISCSIRYETYQFDKLLLPPPPLLVGAASPTSAVDNPLSPKGSEGRKRIMVIILSTVALSTVLAMSCFCIYFSLQQKRGYRGPKKNTDQIEDEGLPSINFASLNLATGNFSDTNMLGRGGFGPVYKGVLPDGKEIAVKRLATGSRQGLQEFKNEVILIAKLQHRNLVRLLFFCIEQEEKLLVYEYMPNSSLDAFLFDTAKRAQLDWRTRIHVINGIARGLLYLHEDSRLIIIHRDIKPSNILLDYEMNPKISDFGMARIFGGNQDEVNTNRVVGTYGYMAPEYAMTGHFSVKSDVFSFGVLLLEIISGRRNTSFQNPGESLLTHAWGLWCDGRQLELTDELILETCVASEVLRCINIGLLCVQEDPTDRPTMSSVVLMLGSSSMTLPKPKHPAFFVGRVIVESEQSLVDAKKCSVNEVTITCIEPP